MGNSSAKAGIFSSAPELKLLNSGRLALKDGITSKECADILSDFLDGVKPEAAILASVVPANTNVMREALRTFVGSEPIVVDHETDSTIVLDIPEPWTVGADRIAGAAGAVSTIGAPVAVVDFGTATTVGFIFEGDTPGQSVFKGGAIMPGLMLMNHALSTGTAQLPEVDLEAQFSALGRDTHENIVAGIVLAAAGGIERIISDVEKSEGTGFQLVLTGGLARIVAGHMNRKPALIEPDLTLLGLKAIYDGAMGATGPY